MRPLDFLDTNLLVYAYDSTAPQAFQETARDCLRRAVLGDGVTSAQALGELAAVLTNKRHWPVNRVAAVLHALSPIPVIPSDAALVRRALDVRREYGLHFYDSLIIAAAERSGATRILTEDLSHDQAYFGIVAHNPFRPEVKGNG